MKYKACCAYRVPWPQILAGHDGDAYARNLRLRGKNLSFLGVIAHALKIEGCGKVEWQKVKAACTPEVVYIIHSAIIDLWPDMTDLARTLEEQRGTATALYTGTYEPHVILRGVTRHCLYADRILLFDPFLDPRAVVDEFSPLKHPEKLVTTTLINLRLWLNLAPWVYAGLVNFLRRPDDYDPSMRRHCLAIARARSNTPDFKKILDEEVDAELAGRSEDPEYNQLRDYIILSATDEHLIDDIRKWKPGIPDAELAGLMDAIRRRRERHPFLPADPEQRQREELIHQTTGSNFDVAKIAADMSQSHLITDLRFRWFEIEKDRDSQGIQAEDWTPLAHAFQTLPFKFLNNVPMEAALRLRKEERLTEMRSFLQRVWRASSSQGKPMSHQTAQVFADELKGRLDHAETEWKDIDLELLRWFGKETAAAVAAVPLIATGNASWLAGGLAVAATTNLAVSAFKHHTLERTPAAFFLDLKRRSA